MPSWNDILNDIKSKGSTADIIRRQYIKNLSDKTGRNIIIYYSGWLQKKGDLPFGINDSDKIGFMSTIYKLDRKKGLDLFLHTPGGDMAATESIVEYLKKMFGNNIRAIVPQLAMSAGTMIALSCKEILMGKHSSLGPIDPQIYSGIPAHGLLEEFENAHKETKMDPSKIDVWKQILQRYPLTIIGECQKAITWADEMVNKWLTSNMLKNDPEKEKKIKNILKNLGDHSLTKSHSRHIPPSDCKKIGININMIEDDQDLQDIVLSIHHACMITFSSSSAYKIIENQNGIAYIQNH